MGNRGGLEEKREKVRITGEGRGMVVKRLTVVGRKEEGLKYVRVEESITRDKELGRRKEHLNT